MTSIMRRTVRGTAAGLGALAIVAGTAACGGLLGGGDEGDGDTRTEESQEGESSEGDSSEGEDSGSGTEEDSSESEGGEESGDSQDSESSEGTDDSTDDGAGSEDGGDDAAAGGALSEDDLTAVGDTYYEFLEAAAAADGEAACALITNPETDKPLEGAEVAACAEGFEGEAENSPMDPSMMDSIDRSMVEAVDNGDGTAGVTLMGQDAGVTFVNVDGSWYIDGSQFV